MNAEIEQLWSKVLELGAVRRASIGFGLREWNEGIAAGLAQCKSFADLTIVTPSSHPMSGFKIMRSQEPENCLASLLVTGQVEESFVARWMTNAR